MATSGKPGRVIEGRYTLVDRIGSGAHGEVWNATDRILGQSVALKWMYSVRGTMQARIRREIATLRMLRFPGVVRLIDEGIADDRPFLVTDLVDGQPFPGTEHALDPSFVHPWSTVVRPTLALLETLSHVHAAGVIHRDLKPENVLVRPDGYPIMLDFGVSLLHTPGSKKLTSERQIMGTPLYLAPEQILEKPADARTDLYAIGVMLHEALTGRVPHDALDVLTIVETRLGGPVRPIREIAPTLPPTIASVIDRLLAKRPEDRYASAAEVIAALRGESPPTLSQTNSPLDERALIPFFAGPDRLFHLREDAARILFERTDGDVTRIETELEQWVRLGLAHRHGREFVVDRASLNRLAAGYSGAIAERPLRELIATGVVLEAIREAIKLANDYVIHGDLGAAMVLLTEGLRIARAERAYEQERAILTIWGTIALAEGTPRAIDGALYELVRVRDPNTILVKLQGLLRAALAAPGANGLTALEMADDIGPFADPGLERARQRIRVTAVATRASPALLAQVLEEIDEWAEQSDDPLAELIVVEGYARRRYHEGRFAEAAVLYARAATLEPWKTGRIEAMLRSASALLEAFEHERAEKTAEEALGLARQGRHAYWEGRAEWLIRSAKYRMGSVDQPDMDLVDAVARVGAPDLEGLVYLNEAAVAMRADLREITRTLADRAAAIWREMGRPFAVMLARSLAIAYGSFADADEVKLLVSRAISCKGAGIGIQALGLLGKVFPDRRSSWQDALAGLVKDVPEMSWDKRMDVLSVNEAVALAKMDVSVTDLLA